MAEQEAPGICLPTQTTAVLVLYVQHIREKILNIPNHQKNANKNDSKLVWRHLPITPAFGRFRQEDSKSGASLGYTVRLSLKKTGNCVLFLRGLHSFCKAYSFPGFNKCITSLNNNNRKNYNDLLLRIHQDSDCQKRERKRKEKKKDVLSRVQRLAPLCTQWECRMVELLWTR